MDSHEYSEVESLIEKIRELAGKIGVLEKMELPGAADSKEYCFQVRSGLSTAVTEILDLDLGAQMHFFRYCLARFVDPDNDRIAALLDALENEIESQMDDHEEKEGQE
ncbi:MAG: hypothetical protein V4689_05900 [Verrucomicrobiota bacterium]